MTKYYYKNQLVRTSKTHDNYTHGLFLEYKKPNGETVIKCLSCSSKAAGLNSQFNYYKNYYDGVKCKYDNSPVQVYIDAITKVNA